MKILKSNGEIISTDPENDEEDSLPFSKANFGGRSIIDDDPHKITDLKPAVRDSNRVNVFLGSRFAFSLDLTQVVDYHLKVGKILTDQEITKLERASEFGLLYGRTLEWVLTRPRSIKETRDNLKEKLLRRKLDNKRRLQNAERLKNDPYLSMKCQELKIQTKERRLYTDEDIEKVIARLIEKKYLDDYKFACWYVENRFVKKGISRRRLSEELSKKGISKQTIDEVLDSSDRTEEEEIKKIIRKKARRYDAQKILHSLVSNGFKYDESKRLLEEYKQNPEDF